MLQSRCTDYPYRGWKLRCIDSDRALLDLQTKRIDLQFEIGSLYLKLVKPSKEEQPELAHLHGRSLHPGFLLKEMSKCGIHLLPRDSDAKLAGIDLKDKSAESRAILDISFGVRAMHFQRAKWNQAESIEKPGVPAEQILVRMRENMEYDADFLEDSECDWTYMSWWKNKSAYSQNCKNDDPVCEVRNKDDQVSHALLSQSLSHIASVEATEMAKDLMEIEFSETVKKTLRLTRLLAFS